MIALALARYGFSDVAATTTDSSKVVALCAESEPDLLLLELRVPSPDGFEVMSLPLPWALCPPPMPTLVLTADASAKTKRRAVATEASDSVTKRQRELLEHRVRERTRELDESRLEVLERLARAAEYRDDKTREHTRRVGRTAALLAQQLGLAHGVVDLMNLAAQLHDVGKVGIPDSILLKPGPLTHEEFQTVQQHVVLGATLLSASSSSLLRLAQTIARTHHERWDGAGYPLGLAGERIPIEGRIAAVADVFDALTHVRSYDEAWPIERAVEEIRAQSGRAFDPQVVEVFARLDHDALLGPVEDDATTRQWAQHIVDSSMVARIPAPASNGSDLGAADSLDDAPASTPRPASGVGEVRTVTLGEAAEALGVSRQTLRRWGENGRIDVLRTAGGHRRFAVSEIRRLNSSQSFLAPPAVRPISLPSQPLVSLAELLSALGAKLGLRAARTLYQDRRAGWFASEPAQRLIAAWAQAVCSACIDGGYDTALTASAELMRHAELAGTSLLERHTFLERFSDLAIRRLREDDVSRAELVAARRLFTAVRQSLLESVASAA